MNDEPLYLMVPNPAAAPRRIYCVCGHEEPASETVYAAYRCPPCQQRWDEMRAKLKRAVELSQRPDPAAR